MGWFPGFRGLSSKALDGDVEGKTVFSSSGAILENSGRFAGLGNRPQGGEWTIDRALSEAFNREPYAFKAIDTIAEKSSSLEFKLKDGEDVVEDHPLYRVLNHGKANPLETGRMFRKRLSMQVLLNPTRGAFVNVVKSRSGDVVQLALLPPDRTEPVPNEDDPSKLIKGFKVTPKSGAAKPTFLSVEEVRWVRNPHPLDPFSASSPLTPAGMSILLSYFSRLFNLSFMRNDGRPGGILGVEPGSQGMTDAEMDRIEAKFGRGPIESGKLTVLQGKIVYTDTAQSPRDMAYQELAANAAKEITVAFGVPESVMGFASNSTYANAEAEAYTFWLNTMFPHNDMIVSAFDEDSDENLRGFLDTSEVEALQEPIRKKREAEKTEVDAGLRSIWSYAQNWGIDVPDIPETRALYFKTGVTPIAGDVRDVDYFPSAGGSQSGGGDELADPAGETGDAGTSAGSGGGSYGPQAGSGADASSQASGVQQTYAARRVSPTQPAETGKPYVDAPQARSGTSVEADPGVKALPGKAEAGDGPAESESDTPTALLESTEKALNAAAEAVVNRQANVVVARLRSPKFKKGTKHWVADESKVEDFRVGVKTINGTDVVQSQKWEDEMVDTLTPIVGEACQSAAEGIIDDLGLDGVEGKARHRRLNDAQAKAVAQTAAEALYVAKSAIRKHSESLAARIKEADEAGKDLDSIIADVQAYAEQYRRGWNRLVMQQVGQVAIEQTRLRVADLSKKQRDIVRVWVSRKDNRTRPAHRAADGQRKRLGDPFKVGESSLRFPGDPLGKPGDVIGCRCRLRFVSKATGQAIPTPSGETTRSPERKALELVWSVA